MPSALDKIVDTQGLVRIIDPIQARADTIQAFLAKNGYSRITLNPTLSSFEKDVSKESVDWLLCHLHKDNFEDLKSTLKRIHHTRLHTRVVILCHQPSRDLYKLYRLGALGHILRNADIKEQLSIFLKKVEQYRQTPFGEVGLSAYYLRKLYEMHEDWHELIILETKMCNRFPRQVGTLVTLMEAYLKSGQVRKAKIIKDQILQIGSIDYSAMAKRLETKYPELGIPYQDFADTFHIRCCVIVEADDTEYVRIEASLTSLKLTNLKRFKNFDDAWDYLLSSGDVDLLICEWSKRSKGLSTEQFIQRLRGHISLSLPLIILDSNLSENDVQIIGDMHVNELVRKPIREDDFLLAIRYCFEQLYNPTEVKAVERRIEEHLEHGDSPYVQHLRQSYTKNPNVSRKRKFYIEGYYCYAIKDYKRAKKLLTKGLSEPEVKKKKKSSIILNIDKKLMLAHCFDQLGDKQAAAMLIEAAIKVSPRNIVLRCYLASLYYELGDKKKASAALDFAASIDSNNQSVTSLRTKISIIEDEQKKLSSLLSHSPHSKKIIERLNFHANRYQSIGDYSQSLKIYAWLLEHIPDSLEDYLGFIYYNQALVFIKDGHYHKAMGALYSAMEYKATDTARKAKALRSKLEKIYDAKQDIRHVFAHFSTPKVNTSLDVELDHMDYGLFSVYAWDFEPIKIDADYEAS